MGTDSRPRRGQRQQQQQQQQQQGQSIAAAVQQHLQSARQTMNMAQGHPVYVYPTAQEHVPVYYTNAMYPQCIDGMNTMEDLEEVLSIHSSSADPLNLNMDNMEINGTNGIPVGNASPEYTPNSSENMSNGSKASSLNEAGPSGVIPAAQAGAQINIQSSTQATVQMNTQQSVPPQQSQIIRNYSTTVPPPGMKILKKRDAHVEERKAETRKKNTRAAAGANDVNNEPKVDDRNTRSAPGQVHPPSHE
jgi:hypothetical protein